MVTVTILKRYRTTWFLVAAVLIMVGAIAAFALVNYDASLFRASVLSPMTPDGHSEMAPKPAKDAQSRVVVNGRLIPLQPEGMVNVSVSKGNSGVTDITSAPHSDQSPAEVQVDATISSVRGGTYSTTHSSSSRSSSSFSAGSSSSFSTFSTSHVFSSGSGNVDESSQ